MATKKTAGPVISDSGAGDVQDAGGWDFDAWLGAASPAQRSVTIYGDNRVQAEIAALEQERSRLLDQTAGGSWGDPDGDGADTSSVDARIRDARARLAASGVEFRLQALDPDEGDRIDRETRAPKGATDDEQQDAMVRQLVAQVAAQIIEPRRFTVEEVERLRRGIGEPEFMKLVRASAELRSASAASDPFSPIISGSDLA